MPTVDKSIIYSYLEKDPLTCLREEDEDVEESVRINRSLKLQRADESMEVSCGFKFQLNVSEQV